MGNNSTEFFLELVSAGLWEKDVRLLSNNNFDYKEIYTLAKEQAVIGLVAAGIEHVKNINIPQNEALLFVGSALQLEQRNIAMNNFIGEIVEKFKREGIHSVLVKGQGIAQCYERPLWRTAGDIDLLLDANNYQKAKVFLSPLSSFIEPEDKKRLHLGMTIEPWVVELHGTMYTDLSDRMNRVIDDVQNDVFINGNVRYWDNNSTKVYLPNPDNDIIITFTHFIDHFFGSGVGLRQICDWCRLLWKYNNAINQDLLKARLCRMRLFNEWKAFAALAVEYLGMPESKMPLYEKTNSLSYKARRIMRVIMQKGNMGQRKDESYRHKYPKRLSNIITALRRFREFAHISIIFPLNAPVFYVNYLINRYKAVG